MNNDASISSSDISVTSVFSKAWSLVHGSKGAIWSVAVLILLIAATLEWITNRVIGIDIQHTHYAIRYILLPILTNLFIAPFYAGGVMVAIKRVRGESINIKSGYQYLRQFLALAITMIVVGLISNLLTMVINIPTIAFALGRSLPYFDIAAVLFSLAVYTFFILSIPMIIDKQYTPGQALLASPMLVKQKWLQIFLIFLVTYLCLFVLLIPTFLGLILSNSTLMLIGSVIIIAALIWLLPFVFLLTGVIYHRLVD